MYSLNLEAIGILQIFYFNSIIPACEASQKNDHNFFLPPLLPIKPPYRTPPLTNLRVGVPDLAMNLCLRGEPMLNFKGIKIRRGKGARDRALLNHFRNSGET